MYFFLALVFFLAIVKHIPPSSNCEKMWNAHLLTSQNSTVNIILSVCILFSAYATTQTQRSRIKLHSLLPKQGQFILDKRNGSKPESETSRNRRWWRVRSIRGQSSGQECLWECFSTCFCDAGTIRGSRYIYKFLLLLFVCNITSSLLCRVLFATGKLCQGMLPFFSENQVTYQYSTDTKIHYAICTLLQIFTEDYSLYRDDEVQYEVPLSNNCFLEKNHIHAYQIILTVHQMNMFRTRNLFTELYLFTEADIMFTWIICKGCNMLTHSGHLVPSFFGFAILLYNDLL